MASLATTLGLRSGNLASQPPSLAGHYLIFQFLFAYAGMAPRHFMQYYGIDNNVSPRDIIDKNGAEAVKSGRMTQKQLDRVKRSSANQANTIESYIGFAAAILFAQLAGVPNARINRHALVYTLARIGFSVAYILIDTEKLSLVRTVFWWTSSVTCLRLMWFGSKAINAST